MLSKSLKLKEHDDIYGSARLGFKSVLKMEIDGYSGSVSITGSGTFSISYIPTTSLVTLKIVRTSSAPTTYIADIKGIYTDSIVSFSIIPVVTTICSEDKYEYGFNGQMKVNEWAGVGNHTTAKFWEYDTRTGRRDNLEPKIKKTPWLSPYCTNNNNPILYNDPNGDFFLADNLIGAAVGALVDIGAQMISNAITGRKLMDIDWHDVGISAGAGFLTSGVSAATGLVLKTGTKAVVRVTAVAIKASVDYKPMSGGWQILGGPENHDKSIGDVGIDGLAGAFGLYIGAVSGVAGNIAQESQKGIGNVVKHGTNLLLNTINKVEAKKAHKARAWQNPKPKIPIRNAHSYWPYDRLQK